MTEPILSIVVPTYNEGDAIVTCLDRLLESVQSPCEVFVVFDTPDDTTAAPTAARSGVSEHAPQISHGGCESVSTRT